MEQKMTLTKEQLFKAMRINEQKSEEKSTSGVNVYKLSDKTVKILTDRLKDEYTAHYYYRAATNWCNDMNYKKAGAFFENEAKDELEHAETLQKYMTDFNIIPARSAGSFWLCNGIFIDYSDPHQHFCLF